MHNSHALDTNYLVEQIALQASRRWVRQEEWGVCLGENGGGSREVGLGVVVRSAANKYVVMLGSCHRRGFFV
jgi:hypothetical protein